MEEDGFEIINRDEFVKNQLISKLRKNMIIIHKVICLMKICLLYKLSNINVLSKLYHALFYKLFYLLFYNRLFYRFITLLGYKYFINRYIIMLLLVLLKN